MQTACILIALPAADTDCSCLSKQTQADSRIEVEKNEFFFCQLGRQSFIKYNFPCWHLLLFDAFEQVLMPPQKLEHRQENATDMQILTV